jgi:hypothetical protein
MRKPQPQHPIDFISVMHIEKINKSMEKCVIEMARMCGCETLYDVFKKEHIPVEPATKDERKAFWLSVTLLHPSEVFKELARIQLKELEN